MLRFYYDPKYKYSNRTIIDVTGDGHYKDIDYENIDSPDTINGHIIYILEALETVPTYIIENNTRRWFVSGITQLRSRKFQISLLRDIISESDIWKSEQAYISAGKAIDFNKYKKWNLPFTNTKIKEERFNFGGKSSFFVFYVNENQGNNGVIDEKDLNIQTSDVPGISTPDITVSNLNEIPHYDLFNNNVSTLTYFEYWLYIKTGVNLPRPSEVLQCNYCKDGEFNITNTTPENYGSNIEIKTLAYNIRNNVNNCREDLKTATNNFVNNYFSNDFNFIPETSYIDMSNIVGKIILDSGTNRYYRVHRDETNYRVVNKYYDSNNGSTLISSIRNINFPQDATTPNPNFSVHNNFLRVDTVITDFRFWLEDLGTGQTFNFTFLSSAQKLSKSSVRCVNIVEGNGVNNEDISKALMRAQENYLNLDNTTGEIVDIQFLPFSIATTPNANFTIDNVQLVAQFLDSDDLIYNTDLTDLSNINKETDTINIVSPSRASQFVFSPYNNDGIMEFTTKITLRPFATAIYVRPSTKGLLMVDFDDKNCLIINEDFSLTKVTSAWAEYVRNNKNYSNIFERQIQGREFERGWERKIEQAQARSDDWTARNISAQKVQTFTGNLPIISSISASLSTAIKDTAYMEAAQLDRQYNEAMYQESLSMSRDLFDMQMENIKAQPSIPSKITTIDCKTLDGVYLEYWSTNETEKQAINNYYFYNGNRIDCYGTFNDYYGWFIRGKIIISNNYTQPEINELNKRLELGIFTEVAYD